MLDCTHLSICIQSPGFCSLLGPLSNVILFWSWFLFVTVPASDVENGQFSAITFSLWRTTVLFRTTLDPESCSGLLQDSEL